jgi:hypothetical protein
MSLPGAPTEWAINANGFEGVLRISSLNGQGELAGTVFNDEIFGFWDDASKKITFMRVVDANKPDTSQVYTGYWYQNPGIPQPGQNIQHTLAGSFEAFRGTGASARRAAFGWFARVEVVG